MLVRGVPFADVSYGWAESAGLHARMEAAVADTADRLATLATELRQPDRAAEAAERGLNGITHPDERLLAHRLQAAASAGSGQLARAWQDAVRRLAAAEDAPSPHLIGLYDRLRLHPPEHPKDTNR